MGGDGVKERLKAWWTGRPGLRRGRKLALNLALSAVLLALLWGLAGYPLPTAEMEFRRLERTNLMGRSEIVFATPEFYRSTLAYSSQHRTVTALDGTEVTLSCRLFVGVTGERAVVAEIAPNDHIASYPLGEGPALLPHAREGQPWYGHGYWVEGGTAEGGYHYQYHSFAPLILLNAPEETARVELEARLEGETYTGVSWEMENNVWLLGLEGLEKDGRPYRDTAYTLRLFDGADRLLLEQTGHIPQAE